MAFADFKIELAPIKLLFRLMDDRGIKKARLKSKETELLKLLQKVKDVELI